MKYYIIAGIYGLKFYKHPEKSTLKTTAYLKEVVDFKQKPILCCY